ncbi:MAG TPA: hypothetical protein VM658_11025 [bacterium]|nr:hypothetical protein [bacterium]
MDGVNDSAGPLAKGTAFLGVFKFLKSRPGGDELLAKALASLPPQAAQVCTKKVVTIQNYPYLAFTQFLRAADKIAGTGNLALCKDIGAYAATRDIESFRKLNNFQIRPRDLIRDCGVYWKSYYENAGHMKTEDPSPENTVLRIHDFPGMDPAHCRLMEGWMGRAMIEAGAVWIEELRETKCASRGHPYHEFYCRWREKNAAASPRPSSGPEPRAKTHPDVKS